MTLVAPLFVFLLLTFFVPIALFLWQSVSDPLVRRALPNTVAALAGWTGTGIPNEAAFSALAADLRARGQGEVLAKAAARLNSDIPGMRSLMFKTTDALAKLPAGNDKDVLIGIDRRWDSVETWGAIAAAAGPLTDMNLLAVVDLERSAGGDLERTPANHAIFVQVLLRTLGMALAVALICLVLGFPLAYLLANSSASVSNSLMFFVLLPLWTSILVRTLSWSVLLQREGILNDLMIRAGIINAPLGLLYNRAAVYVGMVHILLPFMVLALYSVMKSVPAGYMRAASSLGAPPATVFRRVYLPLVRPGITSGSLLVFIQALGVYVTPALLGGPNDQGVATLIAFYVNKTINWGLAAALSLLLLVSTIVLFMVYGRLAGGRSLQLG